MAGIEVTRLGDSTYQVVVMCKSTTTHEVTVRPEYAQKLTSGKISGEELVKNSFEFLLARESNTSILRSFDLSVIARYFPEYERIISQ